MSIPTYTAIREVEVVVLGIFPKDDSDFKMNVLFRLRSTLVFSSSLAVFVKMAYKIYNLSI